MIRIMKAMRHFFALVLLVFMVPVFVVDMCAYTTLKNFISDQEIYRIARFPNTPFAYIPENMRSRMLALCAQVTPQKT